MRNYQFVNDAEAANRRARRQRVRVNFVIGMVLLGLCMVIVGIAQAHHTQTHRKLVIDELSGHAMLVFCTEEKYARHIRRTAKEYDWEEAGRILKVYQQMRQCGASDAYIFIKNRGTVMDVTYPSGKTKPTYVFPFTFKNDDEVYWGITDIPIVARTGDEV